MQRRELLKGLALTGAGGMALGTLQAAIASNASAGGIETEAAMSELLALIKTKDQDFQNPAWHLYTPDQLAEARVMLLASVDHALDVWRTNDPARPWFMRFNLPGKKLLGDNPDAIYYETMISADNSYRIKGNTAGATYVSFTVELERNKDTLGKLGATINDSEFDIDENGNYEIIVSAKKQPGNWLRLDKGAKSIAVRNYFELVDPVCNDQLKHVPISIEPIVNPGPAAAPNDKDIAKGIRRATDWIDKNVQPPNPEKSPHWVSKQPNQFTDPKIDDSNQNVAYAAKDNTYLMAPWLLKPDEALIITGRFPKSRFSSVVLWNQFMQTLDYRYRSVSLNRKQAVLESDGSFRMILAHKNPGKPNWLDTEGRMTGVMFWRFLLAEEDILPLTTQLVKFSAV